MLENAGVNIVQRLKLKKKRIVKLSSVWLVLLKIQARNLTLCFHMNTKPFETGPVNLAACAANTQGCYHGSPWFLCLCYSNSDLYLCIRRVSSSPTCIQRIRIIFTSLTFTELFSVNCSLKHVFLFCVCV